jgi:hypothetical protein
MGGNLSLFDGFPFLTPTLPGGSTLANILHRRIWQYNLTVALPLNLISFRDTLTGLPAVANRRVLPFPGTAHAVVNHLTFTPSVASYLRSSLVPVRDSRGGATCARYFTLLRRPMGRVC